MRSAKRAVADQSPPTELRVGEDEWSRPVVGLSLIGTAGGRRRALSLVIRSGSGRPPGAARRQSNGVIARRRVVQLLALVLRQRVPPSDHRAGMAAIETWLGIEAKR
jgi:hypothetical protein